MQLSPAMLTKSSKSVETWQTLMELRCRREVLERWLATQVLLGDLEQSLRAMLGEVDVQLKLLMNRRY
jgi:hypothetical protein